MYWDSDLRGSIKCPLNAENWIANGELKLWKMCFILFGSQWWIDDILQFKPWYFDIYQ